MLVTQSCLTLCNPVDRSPPGSSVHGILQARRLEWVAISFSREEKEILADLGIEPVSPSWQADSLLTELQGKPQNSNHKSTYFILLLRELNAVTQYQRIGGTKL